MMLARLQTLAILGCISGWVACRIHAQKFKLDLEDVNVEAEVDKVFEKSRLLLTPKEKQFLEQILHADEVIMEREQRGIVDQILATISGVSTGIVGGTPNRQTQTQTTLVATAAPAAAVVNNNVNSGAAVAPAAATPSQTPTTNNNDNHLFSQISKVVTTSGRRNVTAIVDEALKIGTPAPVRDLVNGILGVAYCNSIRRLLGRC